MRRLALLSLVIRCATAYNMARYLTMNAGSSSSSQSRRGLRLLEIIPSQQLLVRTAKFAWQEAWKTMMVELAPQSPDGDYVRPSPQVGRRDISLSGRYELYVGNACPWCHRTLLALNLREVSSVTVTQLDDDAERASRGGWVVQGGRDRLFGEKDLKRIYERATGGTYRGRCTAPLLINAHTKAIAASDSADIARALARDDVPGANNVNLRPTELADTVDQACDFIYTDVNDAVYRCGFCTSQSAYERAEATLHAALTKLDADLGQSRFVCADKITLADVWLYPTLVRFDAVYAPLFRCGRKRVVDYPHLHRWFLDMARLPQVAGTFDLDSATRSYFTSLFPLNPSAIIPKRPTSASLPTGLDDPSSLSELTFTFEGH